MSDSSPRKTRKGRSSSLHIPKRSDPIPVPPSLANSPYLLSPYSVFRRKPAAQKTPSKEHDEWLRDMVPLDWDNDTFGQTLSRGSSAAISVPHTDTSQSHPSSPSSEISPHSLGVVFPKHRPWSTPSTPCIVPTELRFPEHSDIPNTRM